MVNTTLRVDDLFQDIARSPQELKEGKKDVREVMREILSSSPQSKLLEDLVVGVCR